MMSVNAAEQQIARHEKIWIIRSCFKKQPAGGWEKPEILAYLLELKVDQKRVADLKNKADFTAQDLTDEELDLIYNDLKYERMI